MVDELYKKSIQARKDYEEVLRDFIKDYGSFHTTIKLNGNDIFSPFFFDWF